MTLNTPVIELQSVGKKTAERLSYLRIFTIADLLHHYPHRYEDFSTTKSIGQLVEGEQVTITATVTLMNTKKSHRKHMHITEVVVEDETDQMKLIWFRQPYIAKKLAVGKEYYFSGTVSETMFGLQLKNPSFELVKEKQEQSSNILPVYSLAAGLTQKQMRFFVSQAVEFVSKIKEWIPKSFCAAADVIALPQALKYIHSPSSAADINRGVERMKFGELLLHQLRAERVRQIQLSYLAPQIPFDKKTVTDFLSRLSFTLTKDQKIVAWQILQDIEKSIPMNRLLEGDVGSGKTIVAALVAHVFAGRGYQTAIMAPIGILAEQHFSSFCTLFPEKIVIALKTGDSVRLWNHEFNETTKAGQKREFFELLKNGDIDIVIGTHALLTSTVLFHDLGIAIVDEQHRFGVEQRRLLKDQSGDSETVPHFLSMTATPIPRSYALALYGELDISIIKTMPPGRKPVITRKIEENTRKATYDFIREEVERGHQAFVICSMIEASEDGEQEKKTVIDEYTKLSQDIFPKLTIAYIHGKMKADEKETIMQKFSEGNINVLVSTSVVEVGVDIPNATVMMIENAERFGLAQLHQFRGRVGRSSMQSYCFLFTDSQSSAVQERLDFFCTHTDGFSVAEYDLQLRGPGQVYGKVQSGIMQFQFASITDIGLINTAKNCVQDIDINNFPLLKEKIEAWEQQLHLE